MFGCQCHGSSAFELVTGGRRHGDGLRSRDGSDISPQNRWLPGELLPKQWVPTLVQMPCQPGLKIEDVMARLNLVIMPRICRW